MAANMDVHIIFKSKSKRSPEDAEVVDMMEAIERFRISKGYSHKRVYLLGVGAMIGAENPNMLIRIADYIAREGRRKLRQDERSNKHR